MINVSVNGHTIENVKRLELAAASFDDVIVVKILRVDEKKELVTEFHTVKSIFNVKDGVVTFNTK